MTDLFELEAPLDDQGTTEAGPAHMQPPAPVSPLTKHWEAAQEEFNTSGCDAKRNVLVYLVYSDKLIDGSPKNSTSTVPIMPWGGNGEVPRCADYLK